MVISAINEVNNLFSIFFAMYFAITEANRFTMTITFATSYSV